MSDYISRQAVTDALLELRRQYQLLDDTQTADKIMHGLYRAEQAVNDMPSADVEPVKHGWWVGYPECLKYPNAYSDDHIVCSVCEECYSILDNDCERFNYCPNCGAIMDGDEP